MIESIDHIVILVNDLAAAQADYAALGFTVTPGGEHAGGATHNALIAFADGAYLELIAFRQTAAAAADVQSATGLARLTGGWRARATVGEQGLIDFALLPSDIAADVAAAAARGLSLVGPLPGGRRRPDGQEVAWQTATAPSGDLPFLCGDVTPRDLRVPAGAAREHPNGARGVAGLDVVVRDLAASTARYRALLGTEPLDQPGQPPNQALFRVGGATITLIAPSATDARERARLAAHGEGPAALYLRAGAGGARGPLDTARTHGAVIVLL